jgi:hypothetical protein
VAGPVVQLDLRAITAFGNADPIARVLVHHGQRVKQASKQYAAVSPSGSNGRRSGYMRSKISLRPGRDGQSLYVDIISPATTPRGAPYPYFVEVGTRRMRAQPYLRPGLDREFPGTTGVAPARRSRKRATARRTRAGGKRRG